MIKRRRLRTILVAVAFYEAAGNVVVIDTGSIDATELARLGRDRSAKWVPSKKI